MVLSIFWKVRGGVCARYFGGGLGGYLEGFWGYSKSFQNKAINLKTLEEPSSGGGFISFARA